jgi:DNA-binding IclR family transcriptional regulator
VSDIQVIDRAVAILGVMAADPRPLRLSEIASSANLSPSTTRRVLASLTEHGLCEWLEGGHYQFGLRVFEWGMLVRDRLDLRDRSRVELERLAKSSDLTAFLCIRDSERAVCIDRVDGRFAHSLALTLGGSLPLHLGASPRVLLAYSSDEVIHEYVTSTKRVPWTENSLVSEGDILRDLAEIKQRGWSLSDGDVTDGAAAIGAPIFDHAGAVIGAISISGLRPHVISDRLEELVEMLLSTSRAISRRLGFSVDVAASEPQAVPEAV